MVITHSSALTCMLDSVRRPRPPSCPKCPVPRGCAPRSSCSHTTASTQVTAHATDSISTASARDRRDHHHPRLGCARPAYLRTTMLTLLPALAGFAFLDSLDLLLVGVTAAVIFDSRLRRRSPVPAGLGFLTGVLTAPVTFGGCTVLGIGWLPDLLDFRLPPAVRFRRELLAGAVLLVLPALPATGGPRPSPAPPGAL